MMKTLTTLTAVAALIAGISLASAASSMDKSDSMGTSSSHVTGTGKFCISGAAGALNCQYASLSACQKIAKSGETCKANPSSETTGSGSKSKSKY
jgi:hypothetical protein